MCLKLIYKQLVDNVPIRTGVFFYKAQIIFYDSTVSSTKSIMRIIFSHNN